MATSATSEIEEAIADAIGANVEVNVDLQGESVTIEDSNGNTIVPIQASDQPLDVSDAVVTVTDDGTLDVNTLPEPVDVSGATVTVTDDGNLSVDNIDQAVSLDEPLDVSGATVTVGDDGNFAVSDIAGTVNAVPETVSGGTFGSVSVGTSATQILSTNTTRKSLLVQNLGDEAVFVGFDNTVANTNGIRVPANGGTYSDDRYNGPLFGITASGSSDVRFQEIDG